MFIIVNRTGGSITGSLNGESFGVRFVQEKYEAMKAIEAQQYTVKTVEELQALFEAFKPYTRETYKELVEHKTPYLYVNPGNGKFFLKVGQGDDSIVSSQALPEAFVARIIESLEQGIDFLPMIKAWSRFLRNPNYSAQKAYRFANYINETYTNDVYLKKLVEEEGVSEEVALERATTFQTPITQEGLICTYKVSKEIFFKYVLDANQQSKQVAIGTPEIDEMTGLITYTPPKYVEDRYFQPAVMGNGGDAFFSGDNLGHIIKVGNTHRLQSWSQVNTNDSSSGVPGLHTGNLDYIRGFQSTGTVTHNVFVDPSNIGALTNDGSGALRTLEYYVHSSFAGVNRSMYHSSDYAKQTDNAYAKIYEEAVQRFRETEEQASARLNEYKALQSV
jgi:hypothetical protein